MFNVEKLKSFQWVNVGNPDHEDFHRLQDEFKIDQDTIENILDPDEQSRTESEDNYKVIIIRFPITNREMDTVWHTEPLSIIYNDKRIITVCRKRCDILDKIKPAEKTSPQLFILNTIYYIAESYLKSLKDLNRRVFTAKKALSAKIRKRELLALLEVENSYTLYMAGLKGNMGVVDKLEKMRSFTTNDECDELLEDARIELHQATEIAITYSKMLAAIKNTFESVINIDSNTNINRLTLWNIFLMVPTIVVGYYGMNMALPFAEYKSTAIVMFGIFVAFIVVYGLYLAGFNRRK